MSSVLASHRPHSTDHQWRELVDQLTRRSLIGAASAVALAGCQPAGPAPTASTPPAHLMFTDALGTREIPSDVRRVVCLDGRGDLELAALCGYEVIAYYDRSTSGVPYPESLRATFGADVELLEFDPNLEQLAVLDPDLIICDSTYWAEEIGQERFEAIAPLVIAARSADSGPTTWRTEFEEFARVLGKADQARPVFEAYDAKIAHLRDTEADVIAATSLNLFHDSGEGDGKGWIFHPTGTLFGTIVEAVGGHFSAFQQELSEKATDIAAENIGRLDGDVMVRTSYTLDPGTFDALERNPLWSRLPSVKAGRVLDSAVLYTNFGGPALASACVDVVAAAYALAK